MASMEILLYHANAHGQLDMFRDSIPLHPSLRSISLLMQDVTFDVIGRYSRGESRQGGDDCVSHDGQDSKKDIRAREN